MRPRKPDPVCVQCGKAFRPKSRRALSKARFCGMACYGKWRATNPKIREHMASIASKGKAGWTEASRESYREKMCGPVNPAWKGGATYKRTKGNYIGPKYVKCPPDLLSMARTDRYVMEHRLIMARIAGRPLARAEVVHHRDHTTRNNAASNLELWPDNGTHKAMEHGRFVIGAANRWCPKVSAPL